MNQEPKPTPTLAPEGQRATTLSCPKCRALIFITPNGTIVAHWNQEQADCSASGKTLSETKPEPVANTLSPQEEPLRNVLNRAVKALEELYPTERGGYQHDEEYRAVHAVLRDARIALAAPKVVDSKEEQDGETL